MPAVLGFHHLAIQVKDLAAAERFYVEVLGLTVVKRWPRDDGGPGERSLWLSTGGEFIALEACEEPRPPAEFRDPRGGLHLIALRIRAADREAWERKLASSNVGIVHRSRWTLYLLDPEGNRLGLSHFPDEA